MATRKEQRMAADGLPPLPVTMPAVTPVGELKNRTALQENFTEEAARDLYNTPTTAYYTEESPVQGAMGWYNEQPPVKRFISEAIGYPLDNEIGIHATNDYMQATPGADTEVMAHEYAHKYHFEDMPPGPFYSWNMLGGLYSTPHAGQRIEHDYGGWAGPNKTELYANAVEEPQQISEDMRQRFYPWLQPQSPPQPPMSGPQMSAPPTVNPFQDMRQQYFSPNQWVPEEHAPWGYMASGQPSPFAPGGTTFFPLPQQWNPPQFPSVHMYDAASGFGMRGG